MARKNWKMPKWMEKYCPHIMTWCSSGQKEHLEELYNDDGTNSNVSNNVERTLMCVAVKAQINIIYRLREDGYLE